MSPTTRPLHHLASSLPNLRAQSLTRLAQLTGTPIGGRKSELSARLAGSLLLPKLLAADIDALGRVSAKHSADNAKHHVDTNVNPRAPSHVHRVLSIDMGIRNLAYCRLLVRREHQGTDGSKAIRHERETLPETAPLGSISVQTWRRFPLSTAAPTATSDSSPKSEVELEPESGSEPEPQSPTRELFTPPVLAKHALSLLRNLVLHAPEGPPDTVLIERQRWRSGGHAAIQEWTLRVNSLEAMLWSGLEVLRDQGIWAGSVHAVDPGAVTRFWLGGKAGAESGVGETKADADAVVGRGDEGKKGKIAVARRWIESGVVGRVNGTEDGDGDVDVELKPGCEHESPDQRLTWEDGAEATRDAFMLAKLPKKERGRVRAGPGHVDDIKLSKKDDLADCLLQGVAWVKWEQNRRAIVRDHAVLERATARASSSNAKTTRSPTSRRGAGKASASSS